MQNDKTALPPTVQITTLAARLQREGNTEDWALRQCRLLNRKLEDPLPDEQLARIVAATYCAALGE